MDYETLGGAHGRKIDKIINEQSGETLHAQVARLSREIVNLKESGMPNTFAPTRVELKGWVCLEEHPWNWDHDR